MKKKIAFSLVAGALMTASLLPLAAQAGRGGGGFGGGTNLQTQTRIQDRDRLRLQDGSCLNSTATQSGATIRQGNTYGPGDGTGKSGVGPKDGTGYGAPSQR